MVFLNCFIVLVFSASSIAEDRVYYVSANVKYICNDDGRCYVVPTDCTAITINNAISYTEERIKDMISQKTSSYFIRHVQDPLYLDINSTPL